MAGAERRNMAKVHTKAAGAAVASVCRGPRAELGARRSPTCRAICDEHFASGHELEIVDLLEHPKRALADGIIVTPTLLKLLPLPVQRVIGSLSDTNQVLLALSSK